MRKNLHKMRKNLHEMKNCLIFVVLNNPNACDYCLTAIMNTSCAVWPRTGKSL